MLAIYRPRATCLLLQVPCSPSIDRVLRRLLDQLNGGISRGRDIGLLFPIVQVPWSTGWMKVGGRLIPHRWACAIASVGWPIYYERRFLARLNRRGFISSGARIHHPSLHLGRHTYIADGVTIFRDSGGGSVDLSADVHIHDRTTLQTGSEGSIRIGANSHIQGACYLAAYVEDIQVGARVAIAPHVGLYSYDHGIDISRRIYDQPFRSKGPIVVQDDSWIGYGAMISSGVTVGEGAVIGAGSVVTTDVPPWGIAAGVPAQVIGHRE